MAENKSKSQEKPQEQADPDREDSLTPEQAARKAVRDTESDGDTFPVERLISEGHRFLGHPSHVVSGALHGINRKTLTLDEARAAVDAWLAAPVPQEG